MTQRARPIKHPPELAWRNPNHPESPKALTRNALTQIPETLYKPKKTSPKNKNAEYTEAEAKARLARFLSERAPKNLTTSTVLKDLGIGFRGFRLGFGVLRGFLNDSTSLSLTQGVWVLRLGSSSYRKPERIQDYVVGKGLCCARFR